MKRVCVIMCDTYQDGEYIDTKPVDVISSMTKAEELCFRYERKNPNNIYYWEEVMSSEGRN